MYPVRVTNPTNGDGFGVLDVYSPMDTTLNPDSISYRYRFPSPSKAVVIAFTDESPTLPLEPEERI